jgi:hypothetical protein
MLRINSRKVVYTGLLVENAVRKKGDKWAVIFETRYEEYLHLLNSKKQSNYRLELAQKVLRRIALSSLDLSARKGCVVSTTARLLYPRERSGTHCTGAAPVFAQGTTGAKRTVAPPPAHI